MPPLIALLGNVRVAHYPRRFREGGLPEAGCSAFRLRHAVPPSGIRVAFLASIQLLAGCAVPRETVQPAMDYPLGALYNRDGTPKVLPCMAGALVYPAR